MTHVNYTSDTIQPLAIAASIDADGAVAKLLSMEGVIRDDFGRDGTTAFAIALGKKNPIIVRQMLVSDSIVPKDSLIFLAQRCLDTTDGNDANAVLREVITSATGFYAASFQCKNGPGENGIGMTPTITDRCNF